MILNRFISAAAFFLLIFWGCANKVVPTGGLKDEIPPEFLSSIPENYSVNFNNNQIEIKFDEFIQLKELNKQLVISPPVNPKPQITVKKKSVIVEFEKPLKTNTTYTINFGNAIVDIHEDNPVNSFRFVFSTGETLDSLRITGNAIHAQTLKPIENAMVLLYYPFTNDSLILNSIPDYFTRTDVNGNFNLENLKEGKYSLYAISEQNNNYIFDSNDELVGFFPGLISAGDSIKEHIKLFKQLPDKLLITESKQPVAGKLITTFNKPADNVTWDFIDSNLEKLTVMHSKNNDTIIFYGLNPELNIYSVVWFSNGNMIDTVSYQLPRSVILNKDKITYAGYECSPKNGGILPSDSSVNIKWDLPIQQLDTGKIKVYKDSVLMTTGTFFSDSFNTNLVVKHNFESGNYKLILLPGTVTDMSGLQNDSINITYSVPLQNSKGTISYKINGIEERGHLLQLVNKDDELIRQVNTNITSGIFNMLDPGNYFLRLINDENNNLQFDPGDYKIKKLPEEVIYYKMPVTVRANWEVEIDWKIVR